MQARQYTQRVTILSNTGNTPDGHGELRPNWTTLYADVPANVVPLTSRELWSAEGTKTQGTHRVQLRYAPNVTTACELTFEGRRFTITSVIDKDEKHFLLELVCLEQVS